MCAPPIRPLSGSGPSECGTSSPPSERPFKTANNLEPLVEYFKPISRTASWTVRHRLTLPLQLVGLYILIDVRTASERPSLRHAQEKLVAGWSQLSLVSQEPEMSSDRSDLQDPSSFAWILPALAAASFLSSAGFQSVASSANPFLLKQTNPSA